MPSGIVFVYWPEEETACAAVPSPVSVEGTAGSGSETMAMSEGLAAFLL